VIAELNNSTFFYAATWRQNLFDWALDAVKTVGASNPVINAVTYIFQAAIDELVQRRTFYQNYTLHYLVTYSPADLGLSDSDANLILSSLYESRIQFYDIVTSQKAQAGWATFGTGSLNQDSTNSAQRLADNAGNYQSIGNGYDFIFYPVTTNGDTWIINCRDPLTLGSDLPSIAYDSQNPTLVRNVRIAYQVFLLGLNIAPITGIVQAAVTWYIHTQFDPQIGSEGALMASFELAGNTAGVSTVVQQSVNPWLLADGL